jgi:hypothetical protein
MSKKKQKPRIGKTNILSFYGAPFIPPPTKEQLERVNHPMHYGGAENPYEVIKVIEAWKLNFNLGNCAKYIGRADLKGDRLENLEKGAFYLLREIETEKKRRAAVRTALSEARQ